MPDEVRGEGPKPIARSREVAAEATALRGAFGDAVRDWRAVASARIREHPYSTLAGAAFTGYVLGGGLPRGSFRFAATHAGRILLTALLHELIEIGQEDNA